MEGTVLGGLSFLEKNSNIDNFEQEKTSKEDQASFTTKINLQTIIAIRLDTEKVKDSFGIPEISDIKLKGSTVISTIKNKHPEILKNGKARLTVKNNDGQEVFTTSYNNFDMAPKTKVDIETIWRGDLKEGNYKAEMIIIYGEHKNRLVKNIEVNNSDINSLLSKENSPNITIMSDNNIFLYCLLSIGGLIIIALGILFYRQKRQFKKQLAIGKEISN